MTYTVASPTTIHKASHAHKEPIYNLVVRLIDSATPFDIRLQDAKNLVNHSDYDDLPLELRMKLGDIIAKDDRLPKDVCDFGGNVQEFIYYLDT